MGKKGGNKKTKALYAPKAVNIKRKARVWTVHTIPGAQKRKESVSLGIVLRDLVGIVATMKEAKSILQGKEVKVNGVVKIEPRTGIGLFDTITIEKQKLFFRAMLDKKGRIYLNEMEKEGKERISKVSHKKMTAKGVQITTSDGRIYLTNEAKVDDSLKIKLPEGKIEGVIPLENGALVFITKGEHCAQTAIVKEIVSGTIKRSKLVKLESKEGEFETVPENIIVIGKGKPALEDLKQ